MLNSPHIAIFGLGDISKAFLQSDFSSFEEGIIVVEKDTKNSDIEELRAKGIGVIVGDVLASSQFDLFDYKNTEYALIALGNDQLNIEVAIRIIQTIKNSNIESPTRLIVHIGDKQLGEIFHQNFILPQLNNKVKIDIKTFSFFDECAQDLFEHYSIDGTHQNYLCTAEPFSSVVCGDGELALNIIEKMLLLSNFPYKNKHTIYLLDAKAEALMQKIAYRLHYTPEKFPTVGFVALNASWQSVDFYTQALWTENHLVNAIVCYDNEELNLKISIELSQRIYIQQPWLNTRVLLGIYNEYLLSSLITQDNEMFKRFFTFGNLKILFNRANLLNEDNYRIAKNIHNGYGDIFVRDALLDSQTLDTKWYLGAKYSDKLSSMAQAYHVNIKLKSLGLDKQKSTLSPQELLVQNQAVFDSVFVPLMQEANLDYKKLGEYSTELPKFWTGQPYKVHYAPDTYTTFFDKLVECEHERWNSYHYLHGWEYLEVKNKAQKLHNCLKALSAFKEPELQITIFYDIYSIVYLPNYLANTGWEIITKND